MRATTSTFSAAVFTVVASVALSGVARADAGDYDTTFGGDGIVRVPKAYQVAPAADGGVWVGSAVYDVNQVTITRLTEDGTPDPTFGDDGEMVWVYPGDGRYPRTGLSDLVALPDGGVQLSGDWCADDSGEGSCQSGKAYVARFDATGAPELDFAEDGLLSTDLGTFQIASLGTDLSISACHLNDNSRHVRVQRYLADGRPDTAFGDHGRQRVRFAGQSIYRGLILCGVTPDDNVAVAVRDMKGALRVKELTSAGALDASYGTNGNVLIRPGSIYAFAGVVSADGGTLFVGQQDTSESDFPRVLKLTADGAADASFGDDGVALLDIELLHASRDAIIAERSDGSIAVAGSYFDFAADAVPDYTEPAYLSLLTPGGQVDASFGDEGIVTGFADDIPTDMVVDGADRIVCAVPLTKVVRFQA